MFIRNKYLVDSDGKYIQTIDNEYFLTADMISLSTIPSEVIQAIKAPIIKPVFRLFLLNPDESVREDISEDILFGSGSLEVTFQNGQRRSLSITLKSENRKWYPNPMNGYLWKGTKFRFDIGIVVRNDVYWKQSGIFTPTKIDIPDDSPKDEININFADKFALLDGTLGGKTESSYNIPVGTKIRDAIQSLLLLDKGNGVPFDMQDILFPPQYENSMTAYTIKKSASDSIGNIILELAQMVSCDVYYNEVGSLVIESGVDNLASVYKPIVWDFKDSDMEYIQNPLERDFSQVINKVIVVGANFNGSIFDAYAENRNPNSPTNIFFTPDINVEYIEDSNVYSDEFAQDLADYTLHKKSMYGLSISFVCTYMPIFDVNTAIQITNKKHGFKKNEFLIQRFSVPIRSSNAEINMGIINIKELPF